MPRGLTFAPPPVARSYVARGFGRRYRRCVRRWSLDEVRRLETAAMRWTLQAQAQRGDPESDRLCLLACQARFLARRLRWLRLNRKGRR